MQSMPAQSEPGSVERAARWAVAIFLGLAMLVLAFGLGFGVKDLLDEEDAPSTTAAPDDGGSPSVSVGAAVIDEIVNILGTQYVDRNSLDPDALKDAAIDGIIASLNDRETSYITPQDLASGALELGSTYEGIGATVSDRDGFIRIVAPFRDSPAERAGILAGDRILEVDGETTEGWTSTEAVQRIRGARGTSVVLTVEHPDGTVEEIEVTRGDIDIDSVFTQPNLEIVPGETGTDLVDREGNLVTDICYVAISQFHDQTVSELREKAGGFEGSGCTGLIVDVRSNPGGGLQATIDVTDEFLDDGVIITEVDSAGNERSAQATEGGILTRLPIVILQDGGSASGAEVLAAALRDNGRATIIGTTSFGKGTVNRLVELENCGQDNCGAIYLSIGRWLTPNGELIEGLGIDPDIEVTMTGDQYLDEGDVQMYAAIEELRANP